jgi:hypothetical protein
MKKREDPMGFETEEARRLLEGIPVEDPAKSASGDARDKTEGSLANGGDQTAGAGVDPEGATAGEGGEQKEPHPLAEFGVTASGEESLARDYSEQVQAMTARIQTLEAELTAERTRKSNPLMMMSEEDVNKRVEELADDGKTVEAVKLLTDWREAQRAKDQPAGASAADMQERIKNELFKYAASSPERKQVLVMLADPKMAPRLQRFAGVIRGEMPGSAEALHMICLGMKANDIYQKGLADGRASVGLSSAGGGSRPSALKNSPVGVIKRKVPLSERLMHSSTKT